MSWLLPATDQVPRNLPDKEFIGIPGQGWSVSTDILLDQLQLES